MAKAHLIFYVKNQKKSSDFYKKVLSMEPTLDVPGMTEFHLGTEGMTGGTGKDNPRIHFSVHYDWKTKGVRYWSEVGHVPPSVPFKLKYCQTNCDAKKCNSTFIDIRSLFLRSKL